MSSLVSFCLSPSIAHCSRSLPDLPNRLEDHISFLSREGEVTVCGGFTSLATAACHVLDSAAGKWTSGTPLRTKRYYAATTKTPSGAQWITGGIDGSDNRLKTTELIGGMSAAAAPDLPVALRSHCIVALPAGRTIIIGGTNGTDQQETHLYSWQERRWTRGPPLRTARHSHSCGVMDMEGRAVIVVAGGFGIQSVELLDAAMQDGDSWSIGPDLPGMIWSASMVEMGGDVILIGGFNNKEKVLRLHSKSVPWTDIGVGLETGRRAHSAVVGPKSLC